MRVTPVPYKLLKHIEACKVNRGECTVEKHGEHAGAISETRQANDFNRVFRSKASDACQILATPDDATISVVNVIQSTSV